MRAVQTCGTRKPGRIRTNKTNGRRGGYQPPESRRNRVPQLNVYPGSQSPGAVRKQVVIANQRARWCGNSPDLQTFQVENPGVLPQPGDCHTSDIGHWFAMTAFLNSPFLRLPSEGYTYSPGISNTASLYCPSSVSAIAEPASPRGSFFHFRSSSKATGPS